MQIRCKYLRSALSRYFDWFFNGSAAQLCNPFLCTWVVSNLYWQKWSHDLCTSNTVFNSASVNSSL